MGAEREHTRFSPSMSEQYFYCPGCVNLLARVPALPKDEYAIEGEKAHDVLETGLRLGIFNARAAKEESVHCVDDFNPDFYSALDTAFDWISLLLDGLHISYGDTQMFVETRVNPPCSAAPGEAAGYCDVAILSPSARKLWVIDYKHGVGITKAVEGNTQVMQYAAGFVYDEESPIKDMVDKVDEVTLVIIQPRSFHKRGEVRETTIPVTKLVDYLMLMDEKIEAALAPDAPLIVDVAKQCRTCDARALCPALESQSAKALVPTASSFKEVTTTGIGDVSKMDPERLAHIKMMQPTIMALFKSVDKRIYELLSQGQRVPGFKQVMAESERKWYGDEHERAVKLSAMIGVPIDELYRVSFKPLTEVEELMVEAFKSRVGKKQRNNAAKDARQLFAYFTTKESSGKISVVPEDDPRPAVDRVAVNFAHVNVTPPPKP